ncbi:MAG: type I DNA topoisomerase [Eubacteriales bacterium]|nr:type I DNA topoisomerase [Eubacteriales bacterium]MDD3880745.1 type I DNA topoisomerase [Eubacteriales bacterium]MDD3882908.1 type I DNA topoisomerase [Eubacteriales bacterium]MDD4511622.1 type I DNA topoisomerase [Eubacteriales bacterium]
MANTNTKLIIVESPAKARTVERFLGKGYKVEASQGHIRDLPKSQLGVDVADDFAMKYITIRGRGEILAKIRKEAKAASKVYLATDPDREGEAISWHLAEILGIDPKSSCRIEFHEVTSKAVKNAIKGARAVDMDRVDAQQARRALDRLVGYEISPLLWAKVRKGLSAGRVQSVATAMVVRREQEIDAFIPEEFWDVHGLAQLPTQKGKKLTAQISLSALDAKKCELTSEAEAKSAAKRMEKAKLSVTTLKNGEKRKNPAPPFTTSSLQQEASRKLNFTTLRTMQVVQSLYEGVDLKKEGTQGLVTYIRTDSVRVSEESVAAARKLIPERFGADYLPEKPNAYKGRQNAQDAHEAIRPTDVNRTPESVKESLTREQYMLYRLIYNRFISSQMTPALYQTITMELSGDGVTARYYGEHKAFQGFTVIYEEDSDDETGVKDTQLPQLAVGDKVEVSDIESIQHFTQPPARYTEASLVRALEEKGIGRPSTYAPTITTILARGYVAREKKRLFPTELGKTTTALMEQYFSRIVDTDFTAEMESDLDKVADGSMDWKDVLRTFYPPFEKCLRVAEEQMEKIEIKDEESDVVCEQCGAKMVYKRGRFGKFLACPNFPECRNTKPILKYIDAPCPKCGARLLEKTSHKNRRFYGCEKYPECDFVSWEMPVAQKCEKCGSYMVLKRQHGGKASYLCANETCRHRVDAPQEEEE